MKIDWKFKLSSRKFWAAVVGVIVCVCVIFGVDVLTQEKVTALVMAIATLISYIIGEGLVDAASAKGNSGQSDSSGDDE